MTTQFHCFFFLLAFIQISHSELRTSISFTVNDKIQTSDDPIYVDKESHTLLKCSSTSAAMNWTLQLTNETKNVINSTGSSMLTYSINAITCKDSGRYTCSARDRDHSVKAESLIFIMVNDCPPVLCHDAPRTQTLKAELHTNATFTVCIMADKGRIGSYNININGQRVHPYDAKYRKEVVQVTPIHFDARISVKDVRPADYRTYSIVVIDAKLQPLMTFTFDLEGTGHKCPSDWCQTKAKKCIYVDGPSPNFNWARDRCQLFGGELVSDHVDDAFINCITVQMKRANTSSMVAADDRRQCSIVQLEPLSYGAKSSCDTYNGFYFGCQILFWSYRPVSGVTVQAKSVNSMLVGVVVPAAVVVLALGLAPIAIFRIWKGKKAFNSRRKGVPLTAGTEDEGLSISQDRSSEDFYDIPDDISDQYDEINDSPLNTSQVIHPDRPMVSLRPGEYITPRHEETDDSFEHYNIIENKAEYTSILDIDACEYITPLENYVSTSLDIDSCEYITPLDSYVIKSEEMAYDKNSLLSWTQDRPPDDNLITTELHVNHSSESLRNLTDFAGMCRNYEMTSSNLVGESDIEFPTLKTFTYEDVEDLSEISLENGYSDFESTDIKKVDDLNYTDIKEVDDLNSAFQSTNIKKVDDFKSDFHSTDMKKIDDLNCDFQSTNIKEVDDFHSDFQSTNIKEVDDFNSLTRLKEKWASTAIELCSSQEKKMCIPSKAIEDMYSSSKDSGIISDDSNIEMWRFNAPDSEPVYQQCVTVSPYSILSELSTNRQSDETFLKVPDSIHGANDNDNVASFVTIDDETNVKLTLNDESEAELNFEQSDHGYYMLNLKQKDHTYWKISY